ncbi:MAG TPA: ribosome recycling factor [Planctomycetota bacterium]|nr:ribosome recycling factor [Planctomycetota bacterium]
MDIDEILLDTEDRMIKCAADFDAHLKSMRSGQATAETIEHVHVHIPAYGDTPMPLKNVAVIAKADARMLTVKPFDAKTIKELEKGLQAANLGLNIGNDGKIIRVTFPPLSEETRKKQVKSMKDRLEQHKVSIRTIRHDGLKALKGMEKGPGHSEDEVKKAETTVNDLTKEYEGKLDAAFERKSKEIMTV